MNKTIRQVWETQAWEIDLIDVCPLSFLTYGRKEVRRETYLGDQRTPDRNWGEFKDSSEGFCHHILWGKMITSSWQFDIEMRTHVIYALNFQSDHKSDVKCNRDDQQLSITYHVPGIFIKLILQGRYFFYLSVHVSSIHCWRPGAL